MPSRASARLLAGVIALAVPAAALPAEPAPSPPVPARPPRPPAPAQKPPPVVLVLPVGAGVLLPLVVPSTVPRARTPEPATGSATRAAPGPEEQR